VFKRGDEDCSATPAGVERLFGRFSGGVAPGEFPLSFQDMGRRNKAKSEDEDEDENEDEGDVCGREQNLVRTIFMRAKAVSPLPLCHRSPKHAGARIGDCLKTSMS